MVNAYVDALFYDDTIFVTAAQKYATRLGVPAIKLREPFMQILLLCWEQIGHDGQQVFGETIRTRFQDLQAGITRREKEL